MSLPTYPTVRELLADPARWCQGTAARDSGGREVYVEEPDAVRFCLTGALWKVYGMTGPALYHAIQAVSDVNPDVKDALGQWNDSHTHADVLALVEKAGV